MLYGGAKNRLPKPRQLPRRCFCTSGKCGPFGLPIDEGAQGEAYLRQLNSSSGPELRWSKVVEQTRQGAAAANQLV